MGYEENAISQVGNRGYQLDLEKPLGILAMKIRRVFTLSQAYQLIDVNCIYP